MSSKQTIFDGCKEILEKERQDLYEYETDGLIFTHMFYGVGSNVIGKTGPKTKITWEYSFKWKPPQYNTVDFLVTTLKNPTGEDVVKSLFEDGISASQLVQYNDYKILELRCGFSEKYDGYINPCQDIIDDNLPEYKPRFEDPVGKSNDYLPKRFYPTEPYDPNAGICNIMLKLDDSGSKQMFTKNGEVITDNTIVEFSYDIDVKDKGWNWQPLRVRYDKTGKLRRGEREYGNAYKVCNENWKSIHPSGRITEDMLMTGIGIPDISVSEDVYYNTPAGKMKTENLKNFHNLYVKKLLINGASKQGDTLIDFACGKAGDLPKWISARLSFVFGVDYSKDNLENRLDGACVRYLKARKINKHMPYALFVHGNSAFNIRDGGALLNDKAKQITAAVFGNGTKESDKIGKGVARLYGKGDNGFNVSSCQFAIHYFFENPDSLRGFLKNVAECTKLNGYFIGTSYDGKTLFKKLKKVKTGEGIQIVDEGKKIWEVIKDYGSDNFDDDSSSIGYRINVYQESINQYIYEYLVNYDYLDRIMEAYGFKLISREEANEMGLPSGSGLFSELFINMLDEIQRNKFKASLFGEAPNMTSFEKEISFLNRFFVYKKVRDVNIDKIQLELGEYEDAIIQREKEDTKNAVVIAKEEEIKLRPKIRKLSKKILLVAATEAVDEPAKNIEQLIEKQDKKKKKTKVTETKKPKKLLIIESDEEK
jgi:mRNA (guanine-N7-)-methyltransferase